MSDKENWDKLQQASRDKISLFNEFTKTILIMLSAVLSVIVSLYDSSKSVGTLEKTSFIITISLFTFSVLFGCIDLRSYISHKINEEKFRVEVVKNSLNGIYTPSRIIKVNFFYIIARTLFLVGSILSLISLVVYSIFKVYGI